MKIFTLFLFFATTTSFISIEDEVKGTLSATVDGRAFALEENQLMRGILVNKDGSMDGRTPPRTVMAINFTGPSYKLSDDKPFTERIEIEIGFDSKTRKQSEYFFIGLQHQSTSYFMIKESGKLKVTQMNWSADKKSFRVYADFECKMRSFGFPNDKKKDVTLKGSLSNIRITVPSWIAQKL